MIKVFFIAKIKDLNEEYNERSSKLREMAEAMPGFVSIESEEIDDVEITVSTWRSKEDVEAWAKDTKHIEAKRKHQNWYHWVRGIHVETVDDE